MHPDQPPDLDLPFEKKGGQPVSDVTPDPPATPQPKGVDPDDLPGDGALTSDQRDALRSGKYSDQELLDARDQARARGDKYQETQLETALDDRGYRAPRDEKLLTAPPERELADFAQVQALADKYSKKQLQELYMDAAARKDHRLARILENAVNQKG